MVLDQVEVIINVACMSFLGVLCRCLLHWAFQDVISSNPALYVDIVPNMLGSFIMGMLSTWKPYRLPNWHVGLSRGFCGCLTSFSSWQVSTTLSFLHCTSSPCVFGPLYQLPSSWAACMGSYHLGSLVSPLFRPEFPSECPPVHHSIPPPSPLYRLFLPSFTLFLFIVACSIWTALSPSIVSTSLLFAPVGALLRSFLAFFGPRGTFACNALGTVFSCLATILWNASGQSGSPSIVWNTSSLPMMAMFSASLSFGLSGALSTVSTMAHEIAHMKWPNAILYWVISVSTAQAIAFIILAPVNFMSPKGPL